jgi:hypothetical protein
MSKIERPDCRVIAQALCAGPVPTTVRAVTGQAARDGRSHIAVRFGSLLLYLEDREALDALSHTVERAASLADRAFGPVEDSFTQAAERELKAFERGQLARESLRREA